MNSKVEILVVEDSPTQATKLRYLLESCGYTVAVAYNGLQALEAAYRRKPDLIISDIVMPQMDGYQLCKAVKADEQLRDIPLLLVTSLTSPQDVIKGLECGADSFIRKPYDEKYLLSRIEYLRANQVLRQKQHGQMGLEMYLGGQRHFITAERQQILDLLISTYAEAIRLNEGLSRSNQWLHGLYHIAEGLNQAQNEQDVCETAVMGAVELPGIQAAWIFLHTGIAGTRLVASSGLSSLQEAFRGQDGVCECCRQLLSNEFRQATKVLECERLRKMEGGAARIGQHATVPLWAGDQIFGVMNLSMTEASEFSDEDLDILYGVGNQVGIAIERAQLRGYLEQMVEERTAALQAENIERKSAEEEARRQAARAESLVRSASRLNADLALDTILSTICEEAAQALQVPVVTVSLYDKEDQHFYHAADLGLSPEFRQSVQPIPHRDADLLAVNEINASDPNAALYVSFELRTMVSVKLAYAQEVIGRLDIFTRGEPRHFSEDEMALLQGLGHQAAQAIANARLFEDAQRRMENLHALHAIDKVIMAVQELPVSLDMIVQQIATQLQIDLVDVVLFDPETETLFYAAGTGDVDDPARHVHQQIGEGHVGRVAAERRLEYVSNLNEVDDFRRGSWLKSQGFVSYFGVPLLVQGELKGVLELFHRSPLHPKQEWLEFLQSLALQTAIAIAHAELFTQTRLLLQRSQEQARKVEQIMNTVPEGVLFLDPDFRVQVTNEAAESHLALLSGVKVGERLETLGNRSLVELLDGAQKVAWQELVTEGKQHIFEVAARPMQINAHNEGWVLVLREVTRERQNQQRMQVQDRLATVGQLAAGIAHDFNNLLVPIMLYTELMLSHSARESRMTGSLEKVLIAATRAKQLVRQILAFSRQDTSQAREPVQLQPHIKEVLKLMEASLPSTIEVRESIDPNAESVLANPVEIHQILMNLCTNAFHAMKQEGGTLSVTLDTIYADTDFVSAHAHLHVGSYLRLRVTDTGHGIERAILERIFDPFFTTKPSGEGTGMGLSVVYGIVMSYGGDITVDSVPGKGTTFSIYFPQLATSAADVEMDRHPLTGGDERILLVDDEEEIVHVTRTILSGLGYNVTAYTSSVEALAHFHEQPDEFDLVITDLTMPQMGGIALAEALLTIRSNFPILMMSGAHENIDLDAPQVRGITLLTKPFLTRDLATKVRHLMDAVIKQAPSE